MKRVKTKLSKKILLAFLGALVGIVMAVTLIGVIAVMFLGKEVTMHALYVSQVLILFLVILAFYRIVDRLVVRRIRELNDAMSKVTSGDYEISVPIKGRDELSSLADSFNAMTGELKANAFLSKDFARYVSHEFKTPLAVIRNYAEITQDDFGQPELIENMDVIISEADRLTGLSKDILNLCRLDSTTLVEKKDRFSPAAQICSVILDLQLLWGEKNIEMLPELEEFEIISNEALLFHVWQNVIGNAIKFTGQNGRICVTLKQGVRQFVCEIADNGVGMGEEEKAHIFTPFYSGNTRRNHEGSGLGLSLSKKIIDKLGGTIAFESELGKGTVFTITLPY